MSPRLLERNPEASAILGYKQCVLFEELNYTETPRTGKVQSWECAVEYPGVKNLIDFIPCK
jgi:hypothetical protein